MIQNGPPQPEKSGGLGGECADSATVGPHDMTRGKDRERVLTSIVEGWGDVRTHMPKYMSALNHALGLALKAGNPREIRGCVATMEKIVAQIQKQEHHTEGEKIDQSITVEYVNRFERGEAEA